MNDYIFKIRKAGDNRNWENIPAMVTGQELTRPEAGQFAREIADSTDDCTEVRYNAAGSLQGHYVRPARASVSGQFVGRLAATLGL